MYLSHGFVEILALPEVMHQGIGVVVELVGVEGFDCIACFLVQRGSIFGQQALIHYIVDEWVAKTVP